MALTAVDRALLQRCLNKEPGAWNEFVDRFLGLIYHVIQYTSHNRSVPLRPEDVEDLAAEVLLQIIAKDYAVLRRFRGNSSLGGYLTVIARRICVHELAEQASLKESQPSEPARAADVADDEAPRAQAGAENLEEVLLLLRKLPAGEREVVRLFYMEGRTYEDISTELNIPVNSIGPILTRARKKLRQAPGGSPHIQPKRDQ
ncbi:MAG: sigma-70 family RNA polymerase sigma factor [Gemmataceae bacterium]|nr:sigma-70 family RNA polymerase sigma factor [Gemmataceae bacterium]